LKKRLRHSFSNLKPGQQAVLFPGLGYYDTRRNAWRAHVHGRVFDVSRIPLGTRILLKGLKRAMRASPEQVASETFQHRIGGFLAAPGRRRRIVLKIGKKAYRLRGRTKTSGGFYSTVDLPESWEEQAVIADTPGSQKVLEAALRLPGRQGAVKGMIHMVPREGLSVISDIDDTIKFTDATRKREMLANTFLRPFELIEGMASLYRHWQELGCCFHYVSSSPWQLYGPLAELCELGEFPNGSMHLNYFNVRSEMLKRFRPLRRNKKVCIIINIFRRLPDRKFILVGDSGEKDPEIYRFLARRFPEQVKAIAIRELPERPLGKQRCAKLATIPSSTQLHIFHQPESLLDLPSSL
jgi:hypothetical protein